MKQRRNLSWFLALLVAIPSAGYAGQADTSENYPPYPDVWGYELPYPEEGNRFSQMSPFSMPSGDVVFTYVQRIQRSKRPDGSCCESRLYPAGLSFFLGEQREFKSGELSAFEEIHAERRIKLEPVQRIRFADGTSIRRWRTGGGGICYSLYPYFLVKENASGKTVERKTLLYLRKQARKIPLRESCGDGVGQVLEEAETMRVAFISLGDGTFLAYEPGGNVIIRFDKELRTKFPLGKHVFLVDTKVIDEIKEQYEKKLQQHGDPLRFYQDVNDAVAAYLRTLED